MQAFGTVYLMRNPHDHQEYAVKELTNLTNEDGSTDRAAMNELIGEVRKMGVVSSEFIVRYHTSAIFGGRFYVMMDVIDGVDFRDVVVARQHAYLLRNFRSIPTTIQSSTNLQASGFRKICGRTITKVVTLFCKIRAKN